MALKQMTKQILYLQVKKKAPPQAIQHKNHIHGKIAKAPRITPVNLPFALNLTTLEPDIFSLTYVLCRVISILCHW